jgi:hypothetical protein
MDYPASHLEEFIGKERENYPGENDNLFAFALSQVSRYERFLRIIVGRYDAVNREFLSRTESWSKKMQSHIGTYELTKADLAEWERHSQLNTEVHLEIEAFYLFAKVLLDHSARFIEHHFGQCRGLSLDSHDDLVKRFARFAGKHQLQVPPTFIDIARSLKNSVADFRDYEIVHKKKPRTMHATTWGPERETKMSMPQLYPRGKELGGVATQSESLQTLMGAIDAYLSQLTELILANRDRSRFMKSALNRSS